MPAMFWLCLEEGNINSAGPQSFWWEIWAKIIPIMQPYVCELDVRAWWAFVFPPCVLVSVYLGKRWTNMPQQWAETVPLCQLKPLTHTISILVVNKALIAHLIQPHTLVGALPVHTHRVPRAIVSAARALIHIYDTHNSLIEERTHIIHTCHLHHHKVVQAFYEVWDHIRFCF